MLRNLRNYHPVKQPGTTVVKRMLPNAPLWYYKPALDFRYNHFTLLIILTPFALYNRYGCKHYHIIA